MKRFKTLFLTTVLFNFFTMIACSQHPLKNYEPQWKKVDDFVKKGLPKSALTEVKKIFESAKKEKQDAQVIKSLVYMTSLQQENREDNMTASIREIEKEIIAVKEPAVSILKSLVAEMYWNYFQNNRWKFYDRTNSTNFKKEDIATWTIDDLHKKISDLYIFSIKEEKLLQQTKLEPFDAIIIKGNTRKLRPTLYDLLAHRALEYFKNDERDITRPAYAFEINQAQAFAPAGEFIRQKFITNDSASLHHKALLVFRDLLTFHLQQKNMDALADADIERLEFVRQYAVHPDKERLYLNAINGLINTYSTFPAVDQAYYLQALYYETLAAQYKPFGDTTHRYDRKRAKEICEKIINKYSASAAVETEGKVNCYNLLTQINQQELQFSVEKVNVPGQPFRALVSYRNFNQLYLRIIKADEKLKQQLENPYDEKYWSSLLAATPTKSWQQELPATNDLQKHSAELKIDALPAGDYVLIAGTQKNLDDKKTLSGARLFHVSNISYVSSGNDFFVLNRDNGQPLANAAVQIWEQKYDSKAGKYTKEKTTLYKTDANGFFNMKKTKADNDRNSYRLDITYNQEKLFLNDLLSSYYYERNGKGDEDETTTAWLFTDRGIYRPGQTVYFKGIVTGKNKPQERSAIRLNYESKIYLKDANDESVDSMKVKTNEFGSFSGKFQLPQGTLNGGFSLSMKNDEGSANIQVEEYKRPKFFVDYEKIKGSYTINDTIKITGIAKAYAGNNIDNAAVKYRIVREPRFLYPWLFRKWWQPPVQQMEIAHGEIKTDKDGKFNMVFIAIPDLSIEKKLEPVFDYKVYADVTDINGETRSGETFVSVSYKSLILKVNIASSLPADSLKTIAIRTENMSGAFEPAKVNVTITRLKEEKRLIRNRYWERPDQFVLNKEEYIRNFPYDEYANESDYESWGKEGKVFEKQDSVKESSPFVIGSRSLSASQLQPGFYLIEILTRDKEGREVKVEKYIELYNEKSNQLGRPQYLWTESSRQIEPGEKTFIKLGTTADNLFIIQETDKPSANAFITKHDFLKLNNEKKFFDFTATEADRGGYGVNYLFVKHNRFYQTAQQINVPWTNKELKVEYATFRDKTLPGSEEKWKVKITGYKNEKVAAEMLAAMYDASLDQFYPFEWNKPYLWPYYYNNNRWNGSQNFAQIQSDQRWTIDGVTKYFKKEYDVLIAKGNNFIYQFQRQFSNSRQHEKERLLDSAIKEIPDQKNLNDVVVTAYGAARKKDITGSVVAIKNQEPNKLIAGEELLKKIDNSTIQIRKNFNETAYFFPDLRTDNTGAIEFSFTMPEALTKWKFQALTHSKELALGLSSKEIITQKQLMVQPNAPRFLREGDRIEFSAKIVNLTDKELTGQAELQLFDATTNQSVDGWFQNMFPNQYFTVAAGQSEAVLFPIQVPYLFNKALTWRIVAKAKDISDGEEAVLPVLTNKMLVTETLPLTMRGNGTKKIKFEKLSQSSESETLQNYSLTVEYTSNPAWYAVQALPYLMEYPYECAEQTWNRYYANSLATMIANSSPRIKKIVEQWKTKDTAALLSNLQKNQELKAVLLEETPWVLQAKTEEQQKKNIALLFDMIKMGSELKNNVERLKQMQLDNGGFVWFKGGPDDRYITQYIITGIGHLKKLNGMANGQGNRLKEILSTAIPYLDNKIKADYDYLVKHKTDLKKYVPGSAEIQYLYMRSFFPEHKIAAASQSAYGYYKDRIQKTWAQQSKYMQGMIALSLYRAADTKTPAAILKSLKETSVVNEELGRYWKTQRNGWFWFEAPIETQSLLIEAFTEAGKDTKTAEDLKTWLLKNKQTTNWQTTKATAEACYALLLPGTNPVAIGGISNEPIVTINLGSTEIKSTDEQQEAGTGYLKKIIPGEKINPGMGNILLNVSGNSAQSGAPTWGAVYWQYFENLDKITTASTPLKLSKKLFVEKNSDHGPVLSPLNDGDAIKVGDKIKVRIELRVDRDMEYVHMKDMRASALEPLNVLSSFKWQGGLGYYETTKDASANFFFGSLDKGTYVFEYTLFATHKGNFSNGVTSIQCMYAPEFSSHSEGIRINVE
ncbi:MAG: alpha-2-macroglobulin [Chitinophagaceae bacterium]|nr:alpha-2-macroglobulin [Chitinophagaceae bacterium]